MRRPLFRSGSWSNRQHDRGMTTERISDGIDLVVGVEGCKEGWIAAALHPAEHHIAFRAFVAFADLVAAFPEQAILGVEVPIGLATVSPQACDIAARKRLGFQRFAAVFPSPNRRILDCLTYDGAKGRS